MPESHNSTKSSAVPCSSMLTVCVLIAISGAGQGAVNIVLLPDVCVDHANNLNLQSNTINFYYDTIDPTPVLTTFTPSFTKTLLYDINVTFAEPVINFTLTDISTSGPVELSNFVKIDDMHYKFQAVPTVRQCACTPYTLTVLLENCPHGHENEMIFISYTHEYNFVNMDYVSPL